MKIRAGPIVQGDPRQADGHAERRATLDMTHRHLPGSARQRAPGADTGRDATTFVADLRQACVTPPVALKSGCRAIDDRTARHEGYTSSIKHRGRIGKAFG
jgi:hypothetical protein